MTNVLTYRSCTSKSFVDFDFVKLHRIHVKEIEPGEARVYIAAGET